jgi:hypothetical protein
MIMTASSRPSSTFATLLEGCGPEFQGRRPAHRDIVHSLAFRVRAEYREMPGLRLTVVQAARLFDVSPDVARDVLEHLRGASVLTCSERGTYALRR